MVYVHDQKNDLTYTFEQFIRAAEPHPVWVIDVPNVVEQIRRSVCAINRGNMRYRVAMDILRETLNSYEGIFVAAVPRVGLPVS